MTWVDTSTHTIQRWWLFGADKHLLASVVVCCPYRVRPVHAKIFIGEGEDLGYYRSPDEARKAVEHYFDSH